MKVALAVAAALLGGLLLLVGGLALWMIFAQIFEGADKEGTNIWWTPLFALVAAGGVALWLPLFRIARGSAR